MNKNHVVKALRTHAKRHNDAPLMSITPGEAAMVVAKFATLRTALEDCVSVLKDKQDGGSRMMNALDVARTALEETQS